MKASEKILDTIFEACAGRGAQVKVERRRSRKLIAKLSQKPDLPYRITRVESLPQPRRVTKARVIAWRVETKEEAQRQCTTADLNCTHERLLANGSPTDLKNSPTGETLDTTWDIFIGPDSIEIYVPEKKISYFFNRRRAQTY
ncbi:hypothetical protein K3495_g12066 [Podosphaera aphanis]|nr:hypothetical protein K3495_g12066 [Podosphaera aphanis]